MSKLFYLRSGDGPPVVLIHAGFVDHRMWSETQLSLSSTYDVISYDLRGAGRSPRDEVAHSPADDLDALLDDLGIGQVSLVGLSMGARIAFEFAALHPDRTRSAVLCSLALPEFATSDCDGLLPQFIEALTAGLADDATQLFARMWFDGRRKASAINIARRASFVDLVDLTFASTFVHQQWRTLEALGPVEDIRVPTLFVTGRDDWPDIHDTVAALAKRMPVNDRVTIPDAAHTLNLDQPRAFLRNLGSFLARHS